MSEYIDKQALIDLLENTENEERKYILNYLLTSYKFDQWQTIDEFKANPVDGWCFLIHSRFNHRTMGNHSLGRFWIDGGICKEEHITHVMPIKTPEAPK